MVEDISDRQMTSVDLYLKKINKIKQDKIKEREARNPPYFAFLESLVTGELLKGCVRVPVRPSEQSFRH